MYSALLIILLQQHLLFPFLFYQDEHMIVLVFNVVTPDIFMLLHLFLNASLLQ